MPVIEVRVTELLPGDVLCAHVDREDCQYDSLLHSAIVKSRAFRQHWARLAESNRLSEYYASRGKFSEWSEKVEHVSYGPFRARILMPIGVTVRVPRKWVVAVVRSEP